MTTSIDLSRLPPPAAIEVLSADALQNAFIDRFLLAWDEERSANPALPVFDATRIAASPANVLKRVFSYLRLLDRQRVNEAISAVLAPLAHGADLENIAAGQGIQRLVVVPASTSAPAVLESDTALLRRYLLSFGRPAAGTRDRYLLEAWTAWPAMLDARVNGYAIHGRRGDSDVVIIGPGGRLPTGEERAAVRKAVTAPDVQPEAVAVNVLAAHRLIYPVKLVIEVPKGPDAELVRAEAEARVRRVADERMVIGGEVPADLLSGAAYGPSVIKVRDLAPVVIEPDPYTVPILGEVDIAVEVR
ncbi:baseplate J/gp47 family protein [Devosia sp. 1635]|uniref:baseplate J/gp47 family protein n=1 Tax=Devosia sp. 1635 TaxID=2726066 RepID=UPI001565A875|nr:baseplate J/gp47 family protein [Devosia sp. 1635]